MRKPNSHQKLYFPVSDTELIATLMKGDSKHHNQKNLLVTLTFTRPKGIASTLANYLNMTLPKKSAMPSVANLQKQQFVNSVTTEVMHNSLQRTCEKSTTTKKA